MRKKFLPLFEAFAELIFCSGWMLGALIILLTICNPNIAGAGFISIFFLMLFISILKIDLKDIANGYYFFNPVLVGMSAGAIFELSPTLVIVIAISTIMTFLLTLVISRIFTPRGIPVLSLPFAIVSTGFYLAATGYNKLFSLALYDNKIFSDMEAHLPDIVTQFFKAMGTIIFMPNVVAGAIIFVVILYASRILAIHALISFIAGVFIHSLLSASWQDAITDPYSFNYILVGLALGGTFLLPSLRSSLVCLLAVGVSAILIDVTSGFAEMFNIPVFTLPFNCTVILFVYALRITKYSEYNYDIRMSPELSLSNSTAFRKRFKPDQASIFLPLRESCTISQGENGRFTHQGKWKHACDLIINDEKNSMHSGKGSKVEDYHIFGKEIISPANGYVVNCHDSLPDNPVGKVDHMNNWGNFIIIRDLNGNHIEMSHLQQHSLKVKLNDYVEIGQPIALCGNSGYSPFPHLHIQVQKSYVLGDETIPFNFALYLSDEEVKIQRIPVKGEKIEYIECESELFSKFYFPIGAVYEYDVFENGEKKDKVQFKVNRTNDPAGLLFLEDPKGSRLYFSVNNGTFYIYDYVGKTSSYLRLLYTAIPRFPVVAKDEFSFCENLPLHIISSRVHFGFQSLLNWMSPWSRTPCGKWHYSKDSLLLGTIHNGKEQISTKLLFDFNSNNIFKTIESGKMKLTAGGKNED